MAWGLERIRRRLGLAWLTLRNPAPDGNARLVRIAAGLLVLVGLWLRCRGVLWDEVALDLDEASWARQLVMKPLRDLLIRPPGYMAITLLLVHVFGAWELVLRSLSWASGLLVLFAAPVLAARILVSPMARLFFVALIALHPAAIDLSKEFKPYAVSLALHFSFVLAAASYGVSGSRRALLAALGLAPVSILFAQDALFAFPGLFLALAWDAYRKRYPRHLIAVVAGAAAALASVLSVYFWIWRRLQVGQGGAETAFWADKYGVFFVPGRVEGQTLGGWVLERWFGMAGFPGQRRSIWAHERWQEQLATLSTVDAWLWVALFVAGVATMVLRRRLRMALLVVLPLLVMTAFNVMGFWPLGVFRSNAFILVYTGVAAAFAIDELGRRTRAATTALAPALAFVILPFVSFETTFHGTKRVFSETSAFPRALREALALPEASSGPKPEVLLLDARTCSSFRFYTNNHPGTAPYLPPGFHERFRQQCADMPPVKLQRLVQEQGKRGRRVWMILGAASSFERYRDEVPPGIRLVHRIPVSIAGSLTNLVLVLESEDAPAHRTARSAAP